MPYLLIELDWIYKSECDFSCENSWRILRVPSKCNPCNLHCIKSEDKKHDVSMHFSIYSTMSCSQSDRS